jgi:hypothetical protein
MKAIKWRSNNHPSTANISDDETIQWPDIRVYYFFFEWYIN